MICKGFQDLKLSALGMGAMCLPCNANACVGCRSCEQVCPQQIATENGWNSNEFQPQFLSG